MRIDVGKLTQDETEELLRDVFVALPEGAFLNVLAQVMNDSQIEQLLAMRGLD